MTSDASSPLFHDPGECGLHFFGAVSASISHELKNALAIINEHAGLLEDLSALAERGRPVDPQRLQKVSANIARQVQRADGIIRNMNRFAHSIDAPVNTVDVPDILRFVAGLTERKATMAGVVLNVVPETAPFSAQTRPFFLLNLLWICLKALIEAIPSGSAIQMGVTAEGHHATVWLHGGQAQALPDIHKNAIQQAAMLIPMLGAEVRVNDETGNIEIRIPKTICGA
ncbi:histidine kinase dimerization/phospho-acceptor domain-containing protein [Desulfatirhabdium butyrativorans]|uniref:histidine kinase dimerization/phospho-acceptor domain-containing protein n=1 Tax=Desulfatirhabdium butyrativorans TaxID=340467 RepID=UPI0004123B38|nr:histidine kinase dimerization/phospho-acceptor domain-containing protein [Desulfatirhabdium butyrativorans]